MGKVYAQAIVIALIGLGLAFADRALRPTPTLENKPADQTGGTPAKEPTKEPTKEPVKDPVKEPAKEPAKEPVKEPAKEPTREPSAPANPASPAGPVAVIPDLDVSKLPVKLEIAQAYTLYASGATFIDGRKPEEYAAGRVQGAINLRNVDVQGNSEAWKEFFQNADQNAVHVVYCYGKDCHEADQLQETLKAVGFKQAFVMTSSVEEWKAAGLPTE